jgi:hypothetical protein
MLTEDDLVTDPAVVFIVTKLDLYRAWYAAALEDVARLTAQRDALVEEIRRYVAARVPEC